MFNDEEIQNKNEKKVGTFWSLLLGTALAFHCGKELADSYKKGMDDMTQHIRKQQKYYGY